VVHSIPLLNHWVVIAAFSMAAIGFVVYICAHVQRGIF